MKATYDRETDTPTIVLREAKVRESDEVRPAPPRTMEEAATIGCVTRRLS